MVTMETLLPAWGMANHKKALEMFRWMRHHTIGLIKRKKKELQWFIERQGELQEPVSSMGDSVESGTLSQQPIHSYLIPEVPSTGDLGALNPQPRQRFHVTTHIVLLQEAVEKLSGMMERIDEGVARLSQRTKERLTRRVLDAKDIYIRDLDKRIFIVPEEWAKIVNYGPWSRNVTGPSKTKSVMRREAKYGDRSTWMQSKKAQHSKGESTPQWLHEKLVRRNPRVSHMFTPAEEAEIFAGIESETGSGDEGDISGRAHRPTDR